MHHKIDLGDTIEVLGHAFVLVAITQKLGEPAKISFKQPIELAKISVPGEPGYRGYSGQKAQPDPEFVSEMIRRRSALKLSAIKFGVYSDYSGGYISMIENGSRIPSDEAKITLREALDRLENDPQELKRALSYSLVKR